MIKITPKELKNMKMLPNKVLVKIEKTKYKGLNDTLELSNGVKLDYIPDHQGKEWNVIPVGIVEKVCPNLFFTEYGEMSSESVMYDTDLELKKGDKIYFEYGEIGTAFNIVNRIGATAFICQNDLYIMMKYDRIYCKVRDNQIIPINGYVFGLSQNKPLLTDLIIPSSVDTLDDELVKITHLGAPNRRYYRHTPQAAKKIQDLVQSDVEIWSDDIPLAIGDKVKLTNHAAKRLEGDKFITLGEKYVCFQRRQVQCSIIQQ